MTLENCPAYVHEWMEREEGLRERRTWQCCGDLQEEVHRRDAYIFFGAQLCRNR